MVFSSITSRPLTPSRVFHGHRSWGLWCVLRKLRNELLRFFSFLTLVALRSCVTNPLRAHIHQPFSLTQSLQCARGGFIHQTLCLTRNLQVETQIHKLLRLPQYLHIHFNKVLHLPHNLRFELRPPLRLPRSLHSEVQVLCLPRICT